MDKTQLSNLKKAFARYKTNVDEILQSQKELMAECAEIERTQRVSGAKKKIISLL